MSCRRPTVHIRLTAVAIMIAAALLVVARVPLSSAASPSLGQLNSQLGQQQSRQQTLASSIGSLSRLISALDGQISLVQTREASVRANLAADRASLIRVQESLTREQRLLSLLLRRLARARVFLSRQLVSSYEGAKPDLVSVILEAHGFAQLLEQIDFLRRAEQQQQTIIVLTREAKARADSARRRLANLEVSDRRITNATYLQSRALAGMNALLESRQTALNNARAAQQAALQASRARGHQLQSAISRLQAQQAAAERAAASAPAPTAALGPSGGWVIPYAIVLCESGGQNLPPNSAGASGYYQIIPSTWALFQGTGPAAYLASKAEQDAVASRIWNGGAGASNWVCAGIVGIH